MIKVNEPCVITPRGLPGLRIDDGYVSVEYADNPNRFEWYLDVGEESWQGETPPVPTRLTGKARLEMGLGGVVLALSQAGNPKAGILNLMRFPFGVTRWATMHRDALVGVVKEVSRVLKGGGCIVDESGVGKAA